ncbi:DsbA family oxidoreductase [Hansschlegelia beijingensis]|uniref:Putative DsbA family dithiol-disulfide isomerase n=1 Tax=Hansschlegelia beijingensis TaxID=1133344 RepID=A0A7W6GEE1_9HYPH|nr:DsbA family oxidoreductase [Hansschlegelia beijingensis]MBB3972110.1 putative DsbA family dithiol-disulfide isomerase [Hansschlegelia beijingensis]
MSVPLAIDVFADPVCPWCWIGKRRLEAALAARPDVDAVIRWRPYQLDPSIPPEGLDRDEYLESKFDDVARLRATLDQVTAIGRDEGIAFLFADITRAPNTLDAHRAIRWAAEEGPVAQGALIERLFEAYFTESEDISDLDVIGRAAEEAGLDWETLRDRLDSDEDVEDVREEIAQARAIGVEGVPCFIFENKLVVMGAHPPEVLVEAIDRALGDEDEA